MKNSDLSDGKKSGQQPSVPPYKIPISREKWEKMLVRAYVLEIRHLISQAPRDYRAVMVHVALMGLFKIGQSAPGGERGAK